MEEDHCLFFGDYESPSVDDLFACPALTDVPLAANGDNAGKQLALHGENTGGGTDIAADENALWVSLSEEVTAFSENGGGPSESRDEHHREIGNDRRKFFATENMELQANNCSFCQILREIIHFNYEHNSYTKLEIHGRLGVICHAVLETNIAKAPKSHSGYDLHFEMLDFSSKSTEEVKQFLSSYCLQRTEEGYVMSNDPLSVFYEALSVGLPPQEILHDPDFFPGGESNYQNKEERERNQRQEVEEVKETTRTTKSTTSLSAQRKRTARLTLADLREVFHLALVEASKKMEVCSTVLKKICRRDGINRWPHRKLSSVKKKIAELEPDLNSSDAETRDEAREKIEALRQEARDACGGISVL